MLRRTLSAIADRIPPLRRRLQPQGNKVQSAPTGRFSATRRPDAGAAALPPHPSFHRALDDPCLLTALRNAARELGYLLL